jgi:hypothetical protein
MTDLSFCRQAFFFASGCFASLNPEVSVARRRILESFSAPSTCFLGFGALLNVPPQEDANYRAASDGVKPLSGIF